MPISGFTGGRIAANCGIVYLHVDKHRSHQAWARKHRASERVDPADRRRPDRPAAADKRLVAIAVASSRRGRERMRSRRGAPSALRESTVPAACHVMGAEQDSRHVRSSASSAGQGTLLDHAYTGHGGLVAVSQQFGSVCPSTELPLSRRLQSS
jgi:hypothetical protein